MHHVPHVFLFRFIVSYGLRESGMVCEAVVGPLLQSGVVALTQPSTASIQASNTLSRGCGTASIQAGVVGDCSRGKGLVLGARQARTKWGIVNGSAVTI